jgi:hypothetical protein
MSLEEESGTGEANGKYLPLINGTCDTLVSDWGNDLY